ncbi:ABC transporter ATP-binding protein [Enterocloster clostridioformis]
MKKLKTQLHLLLYTVKLLWKFNKKDLLLVFIISGLNGIYPIVTLVITQNIMNTIQEMIKPFSELVSLMILYSVIMFVGILVTGLNTYYMNQLSIKLTYHMNYLLMNKCSELTLEDLEKTETYDKISRLENDIAVKPYQALQSIVGMISAVITFCSAAGIIFGWRKILFMLILIVSFVILLLNIKVGDSEFLMRFKRSDSERKSWYCSFLLTHDVAFKEIKSYNLNLFLLDKYKALCGRFIKEENRIVKYKILLNIFLALTQDILSVIVMYFAIKEAYTGVILIGTAMTYMNASSMIQSNMSSLSTYVYNIYNSNLYMQLLEEFMAIDTLCINTGKNIGKINEIIFNNVSYDYINKKYALKNINFQLKTGQSIAIVGRNGSGKTTLLKLLGGLYEAKRGTIKYNGIDGRYLNKSALRNQIAILFQDYLKYEGTITENITLGDISKPEDRERINKVLKRAGVDFGKTEDKYNLDMNLGTWFENGSQLSGGQWQKIALARSFYKNASVYIFDEPSAALDARSEKHIFKELLKYKSDGILIYITHNVQLAKKADIIIVLNEGEIIGVGDHNKLSETCVLYKEMLDAQKGEVEKRLV